MSLQRHEWFQAGTAQFDGTSKNTFLVPNGVNFQSYAAALTDPNLPNNLRAIKPPRLGYSGLIGDKLDFRMLRKTAQADPEWSLVLRKK